MFTINIKGKENPKTPLLVKLEAVFFKTGYARVTKALNITGPIKDWDNQTQQFKTKGVDASEKNRNLIEFRTKYLKVAEDWEQRGSNGLTVSITLIKNVRQQKLFLFVRCLIFSTKSSVIVNESRMVQF